MKTRNLLFFVVCLIFTLNIKAQDGYFRVTDLSQIENGSSVIFAARHDSLSATSYYAMSNVVAGKPQGVPFTSVLSDEDLVLPPEIADNDTSYRWLVGVSGGNYTFINPDGDMIGYGSSGTDFVKNGVNSIWSIVADTSGNATSVPNHKAFVITNVGAPNRSIAFRKYSNDELYEKFAPYSNSVTNKEGDDYFFYIDIFVKSSEVTPVVSLPTFDPVSGSYTTTQNVSINCETEGVTIYYTLDGKNPTEESDVYVNPIEVSKTTTIKAFAKKDGMISSGIATATYKFVETVNVSFYENGILSNTISVTKGGKIGELPKVVAPIGLSFSGWTDNDISGAVDVAPNMITSTSVFEEDVALYAVYSVSSNDCVEIEPSSLKQTDASIIAISKDDKCYAMSQIKGNSGQPEAYELIMSGDKIINAVPDNIFWNIAYDNGGMVIYPDGDSENWLYCTSGSNNNAVRIGDGDNKVFELKTVEINGVVYSGYLYNKATERFVGAYYEDETAVDWRAYKLTASGSFPTNIKNQTYHFFKCNSKSLYCTNIEEPKAQVITENTTWGNVSVVNEIVVEKDAVLTVDGILSCADAANLIIKDGAQLKHNNKGVKATFEKEIVGCGKTNENWYALGFPFANNVDLSDVKDLLPTDGDYELYRYNESECMWEDIKDKPNNFTIFDAGRGYLYASEYDATISFVGEVNGESVKYNLTKTEGINLSGFHLIANPFAHDIYKGRGAAIDDSNLATAYYVLSDDGAWEAKVSCEDPIVPCQSILVKAVAAGEVVINKTDETSSQKSFDELVTINVANDKYEDNVYISFDDEVGLEKINHQNEDVPMIYVRLDDKDYAVAVLDEAVREVVLSFKTKIEGEYIISANVEDERVEKVCLLDSKTGSTTNLMTDDYAFEATADDAPERFVLKLYEETSVDEFNDDDNFVCIDGNNMIIRDMSADAVVEVYDVFGRCMMRNVGKSIVCVEDIPVGMYIVRMIDKGVVRTQKVVVE